MNDRETSTTTSPLERMIATGDISAEIIQPGVPTPTVPDAAHALGVEERQIIKSLLFTAKTGEHVLAILSGNARVSRKRLREVTGLRGLELATPASVLEQTGYAAGGIPPVGHVNRLDVILDVAVMDLPVAFGGGGRVDALLRIRPGEILRQTDARVASISE